MGFKLLLHFLLFVIMIGMVIGGLWQGGFFWFDYETVGFYNSLKVDLVSWLFVVTVVLVSMVVIMFSFFYVVSGAAVVEFYVWLFLFVLSMLILLVNNSWWMMFIGWEGLGLTSFWLVSYYSSWVAFNGSLLTFMTNRVGDIALLCTAVMWLQTSYIFEVPGVFILMLVALGVMTKSAQYPFVSWLPAAMAAPTPISALVHSSTLVTAGLYLLVKFNWIALVSSSVCLWLGFMTMLVGSWSALVESDLKKVVAFSTLSQLGLLMMLFSTGSVMLVMFHLVVHAFFKSTLFICLGIMIGYNYSNQSYKLFSSGLFNSLTHSTWMGLTLMNLSALPWLSGFYSKESGVVMMVGEASLLEWLAILLVLSMTVGYAWRILTIVLEVNKTVVNKLGNLQLGQWGAGFSWMMVVLGGYFWSINSFFVVFDETMWRLGLLSLVVIGYWLHSWAFGLLFYTLCRSLQFYLFVFWLRLFETMTNLFSFVVYPAASIFVMGWFSLSILLVYMML